MIESRRTVGVTEVLARHGFRGRWRALPVAGVVNDVYATSDVVLRVATDHPDAVRDAYTESIAGPAAYRQGVATPALLAFDHSCTFIDRPYSIWERVKGNPVGACALSFDQSVQLWYEVGGELAKLHRCVDHVDDPHGFLDRPRRAWNLERLLADLYQADRIDRANMVDYTWLGRSLEGDLKESDVCFLHNDLHPMNIMCAGSGNFQALIDWGDAGFGDAALDFRWIPIEKLSFALDGYGFQVPSRLSGSYRSRIVWDRLMTSLQEALESRSHPLPSIEQLYAFVALG